MRRLLVLFLILTFAPAFAQPDTVSGYLLRVQGDTLYRKMLVCEGFRANYPGTCFSGGVVAIDADSMLVYTPEELHGFGFKWMSRIVHYRALKTEKSKPAIFAPVSILGNRLTLFEQSRDELDATGLLFRTYGSTAAPLRNVTVRTYYIRDPQGRTLKLPDVGRDNLHLRLRKFLKDRPELLPLVDEFVTGQFSIPLFVREVNKQ